MPAGHSKWGPPAPSSSINRFDGEYAFLSNFHDARVIYRAWVYPSSEHAYQAQKATNNFDKMLIVDAPSPGRAKEISRTMRVRPDWDKVKVQIMTEIVQAKFNQHPVLARKLVMTYPRELVEGNWWHDTFWGVDATGKGENHLGKILMQVRDQLRRRP